jgi:hypothetical protein
MDDRSSIPHFSCRHCPDGGNIVITRESMVCSSCGILPDFYQLFASGPDNRAVDLMLPSIRRKTYKHIFYWNERMAQFRMVEPRISEEAERSLVTAYFTITAGRDRDNAQGPMTKNEVKEVILKAGLETVKYLEKYLSIGYMLTGIMPYDPPPSIELIQKMTDDFILFLNIFFMNDRFGRHSVINYNLIIRESLKRHEARDYVHLFPELKTKAKLVKAMEIHNEIWGQVIVTSILASFREILLEERRRDNTDKYEDEELYKEEEIAPRITARSHLKRKYVDLGSHNTKRYCKVS